MLSFGFRGLRRSNLTKIHSFDYVIFNSVNTDRDKQKESLRS
jgi:hypothetical protein